MKYIMRSLVLITFCCISLILSSYTVYGYDSRNINSWGNYSYNGRIKNYRRGDSDNYYSNKYDYRNNKSLYYYYRPGYRYNYKPGYRYSSRPSYRYSPYKYRRYNCR